MRKPLDCADQTRQWSGAAAAEFIFGATDQGRCLLMITKSGVCAYLCFFGLLQHKNKHRCSSMWLLVSAYGIMERHLGTWGQCQFDES